MTSKYEVQVNIATIKTSNSSIIRNGDSIVSQRDKMNATVENDLSPPDNV